MTQKDNDHSDQAGPELGRLQSQLKRLRARVHLPRGRGGAACEALLTRLRQDEIQMDEQTARQLQNLLKSLRYRIEDLKRENQRARRQPTFMR